jgi:hypothetical protein
MLLSAGLLPASQPLAVRNDEMELWGQHLNVKYGMKAFFDIEKKGIPCGEETFSLWGKSLSL